MNERVTELLAYLRELSHVQASGHYVNGEIKECVKEIRIQLGFEQVSKEVKDSKKLLFDSLVEEPSFSTDILFHAVVERKEDSIAVPMKGIKVEDILELVKLFPNVYFISKNAMFGDRVFTFDKTMNFDKFGSNDILILDNGVPPRKTRARIVSLYE